VAVDLSIVVVTHNGRELALATLRSAQAAAGAIQTEWIVVDSGSRDGTPEAIEREFANVAVVRAANRGLAAANNIGLRIASGRYVLLLNPDVEIASGSLAALVAAMDARPDVGLASVLQRGVDGRLQYSIRRFPSFLRDLGEALFAAHWPLPTTLQELEMRAELYEQEHSADWLVGAFLLARRQAVEQVGPMDEGFLLYSEEVDWCYRFRQAGWDVRHLPVMAIIHHAGRRDRGDLMAQLAHSRRRFAEKHHGRAGAAAIRGALILGHCLRVVSLAPLAPGRPWAAARLCAELQALAVQIGLSGPPPLGDAQALRAGAR
jgi:N-acetylglucosaminyl-diphospho-decaprenol L-rhamnosyltransferase